MLLLLLLVLQSLRVYDSERVHLLVDSLWLPTVGSRVCAHDLRGGESLVSSLDLLGGRRRLGPAIKGDAVLEGGSFDAAAAA